MAPQIINPAFVDSLRAAAKQNDAVFDLLMALDAAILIDGGGGSAIVSDDTETLVTIQCALVAAQFAEYDNRSKK